MSLQDNKNALFGKGPLPAATKKSTTSPTSSSTNTTSPKAIPTISNEMKTRKMNEAKENEERGNKFLKTSIFQWSPDHVAAGSAFDAAASAYKAAEEYDLAYKLYLRAADSHEACESNAAAALSFQQATDMTKKLGLSSQTADIYIRIANCWGLRGEVVRVGEFYCKAAKELEVSDPEKAKKLYIDGINYICPEETTVEQMQSNCPAIATDIFNNIFKFLLKYRSSAKNLALNSYRIPVDDIIAFAYRMIGVYEGLDMEASACRMRVTITLLQLEKGDVIAADRTFLEHLSSSPYLKSNESKLAEEFIMAFKQMDIDMLDAAQKSHLLVHLERDIQGIAKSLSLLANHNAPISIPTSTITPPSSKNNESDLKMSHKDTGSSISNNHEETNALKNDKEEEEEEDFDNLINEMPQVTTQNNTNDDDEIDLT